MYLCLSYLTIVDGQDEEMTDEDEGEVLWCRELILSQKPTHENELSLNDNYL